MLFAVLAAALGVTVCSKWFADRAARDATLEHFSSTANLCRNASFPLTDKVLSQIQELSSLKLAIVITSSDDAFQWESRSDSFPSEVSQDWVGGIVRTAVRLQSTSFIQSIALANRSGARFNATAIPLPQQQKQSERARYLILLESDSASSRGSVQAFVLPLATGLFSSVLIALVAATVAARIGKRVERLGEHVQKIASGSFETIDAKGPVDVIHTLYESVNSMSRQLQKSTSQISMNERSRIINLIASGLAHELRNYLTGARLAIQTCSPDPNTQEALSISLKQMSLAEETIQRLLTLRADAPDTPSPAMTVRQIHESLLGLVQPIASHQCVVLEIERCEETRGGDRLLSDGGSIVGAILNLVLNAMEAARPGGTVKIATQVIGDGSGPIEWKVEDNGPGPAPEIAATMFEPFATTKPEGVGLGLAMCRRIAQRQGGDVLWTRRGDWTVFTMRINGVLKQ